MVGGSNYSEKINISMIDTTNTSNNYDDNDNHNENAKHENISEFTTDLNYSEILDQYTENFNFKGGVKYKKFTYKETLIEEYKKYLLNYKQFYEEQKSKVNLAKFEYLESDKKLIKKSKKTGKTIMEIDVPTYRYI